MGTRDKRVDWRERIEVQPNTQNGKPVIKGTGLTVEFVIGLLAQGWDKAEIVVVYPGVTLADVHACLAYAGEVLKTLKVHPYSME